MEWNVVPEGMKDLVPSYPKVFNEIQLVHEALILHYLFIFILETQMETKSPGVSLK